MQIRQIAACFFLVGSLAVAQPEQKQNCEQFHAMAEMARADSPSVLARKNAKAGDSYRATVVYAARHFKLSPNHYAASALLSLIPQNPEQQEVWMTFGDSLCDSESVADMDALDRLGQSLPHDLAKAVLLVPNQMPKYVAYALVSTQDPHSDYAVQMQQVCRAKHSAFVNAVNGLSSTERKQFNEHLFRAAVCRAIAIPEAE